MYERDSSLKNKKQKQQLESKHVLSLLVFVFCRSETDLWGNRWNSEQEVGELSYKKAPSLLPHQSHALTGGHVAHFKEVWAVNIVMVICPTCFKADWYCRSAHFCFLSEISSIKTKCISLTRNNNSHHEDSPTFPNLIRVPLVWHLVLLTFQLVCN